MNHSPMFIAGEAERGQGVHLLPKEGGCIAQPGPQGLHYLQLLGECVDVFEVVLALKRNIGLMTTGGITKKEKKGTQNMQHVCVCMAGHKGKA